MRPEWGKQMHSQNIWVFLLSLFFSRLSTARAASFTGAVWHPCNKNKRKVMCILQVFIYLDIPHFLKGWALQSAHRQKVNFSIYIGSASLLFWCADGNKAPGLPVPSRLTTLSESGIFTGRFEEQFGKYFCCERRKQDKNRDVSVRS